MVAGISFCSFLAIHDDLDRVSFHYESYQIE